jgi:type I restriction enzyme S subunit
MTDEKSSPLVPTLRFPEFSEAGEWEKQKISSILERISKPLNVNLDEMYRQIGIRSHGKGIFHKEPISGKELGNKRVFWVEEDAFVVNIVFAWEQAVASTSATEKGMIASHRFPMYKPKANKSDINYIKYFFLTTKGKELLGVASPGGAGRNRTLGQKEFENLEIVLPEKTEEQQKIAACLSSLDELITAHSKKLDALKKHKKGLMQQLFPAEGQTVPSLRFPEFSEAGEWVEKSLGEIAKPVTKKVDGTDKVTVLTLSAEYGIISQGDYFGKKIAGENVERYIFIIKNDFVYNDRTTKLFTYGTIKRLSRYQSGMVSPIYKCFRFNEDESPIFWEWYFESGTHESQLHSLINEGARTGRFNISIQKFLSISVLVPMLPEQQKIAACLSSLDEFITAQSQKLDALKKHKKGLMQQLFPAVEE